MKKEEKRALAAIILIGSFVFLVFSWLMCFDDDDFLGIAIISSTIFILCVRSIICQEFYAVAEQKGYADKKYFWYSFIFGLVGYLLVIALPDKTAIKKSVDNKLSEL